MYFLCSFLDEGFDPPDPEADYELCCAIVAGRQGLHPDAWDNHDVLTTLPPRDRNPEPEPVYEVLPVDPVWEAKHRRRPVEEPKPKPRPYVLPTWYPRPQAWSDPDGGEIKLTCDDCGRQFANILRYPPGLRPSFVVLIRGLGRDAGWTCIVGRDRCPACSQVSPPEAVGNGAGADQGDEQHA